MWLRLVDRIFSAMHKRKYPLQPPCSISDIETLEKNAKAEFGVSLPKDYKKFLRLSNGLEWNGLQIFANERGSLIDDPSSIIEGVLEANRDRFVEPSHREYFAFAYDGVCFFCSRLHTPGFVALAFSGVTEYECFDTFDELMINALEPLMPNDE